ncbi:alpha/beta fold hydrolase [Streptomyces fuscichromogenes]|uniref:alpha/beta fold hydrolase n=1 Tax=Streptomyces fuscichromogenes TaxID=1324013 RepID=UPI00382EEA6A
MRTPAFPNVPQSVAGPLSPGTHSFRLGGITQRYHVHGTGPVCVAHPGGPGLFWDYLRMAALEECLTMVYVEPIGTGESGRLPSHPHGYTYDRYSRFLQVLINRLHLPEVHLLGHGHGARVAAHHALHRPERLAGVILHEGEPVRGMRYAEPRAVYISGLDERLSPTAADDPADLRAVTVPTLVIAGRHELFRGRGRDREPYEVFPESRPQPIERGGRPGPVQDRECFSRAVRDFVRRTGGKGVPAAEARRGRAGGAVDRRAGALRLVPKLPE